MSARFHDSASESNTTPVSIPTSKPTAALHPALLRVQPYLINGDYQRAVELLRSAGHETSIRNAVGVCLLRLGKPKEALAVFRQLALSPGNVTLRADITNACKRNYAIALLLSGSPSGALDVIRETRQRDHPMAIRLVEAVRSWERSLSWLRRVDWKLNRIEPPQCRVPIDFVPGEFDVAIEYDAGSVSSNQPRDHSVAPVV